MCTEGGKVVVEIVEVAMVSCGRRRQVVVGR
jgi:hypothetical protein